jgi:hypothetical protein
MQKSYAASFETKKSEFTAKCCKSTFSKPLLQNYFPKNKNGHLFLSFFKNLPRLYFRFL